MNAAFWVGVLVVGVTWLSVAWLARAARQANHTDWGAGWMNLLDGINRLFCRHFHRFQYAPIPLPQRGGAILVSNHVSGLDPLLLIAASPRPLRFLIAREQYERFGLNWLFRAVGCIPVDRQQRPERALREALLRLRDGEIVAVFPHGKIHLDQDPPRPLKRGAVWLACFTKTPVYPVRLRGIRGVGWIMLAVFLRSRAQLQVFSVLTCREGKESALLERLSDLYNSMETF